jgi:hypothetical protein
MSVVDERPSSERLELLYDVTRRLATFTELDEVVRFATRRARELFEAEGCALIMLDRERREFTFPVSSQKDSGAEPGRRLSEIRFPADRGIAGWVVANDEAALVEDTSTDPRFYGGVDRETEVRTQSLLCAPLRSGDGSIGVIEGTRKGAFVLTSDGKRERWEVSGPHFAGWEIYHLKGSPADPNRLYASQSSGWFGQLIQRSDDGGQDLGAGRQRVRYDGVPGTHQWYDGTPHPWEFKRVWHLEPSLTDPDTVYAGVEDAALFRTTDGGQTWQELPGCAHGKGHRLAARRRRHVPAHDPARPERPAARIFIAISAAGAFRTDDGGETWKPINRGLKSEGIPIPTPRSATACTASPCTRRGRRAVHAEALGRDAQRRRRRELVARGQRQPAERLRLPDRRARPRAGDDLRRADQERLGALPARRQAARLPQPHGGNEWEPLTNGLPQSDCYVNVLRDAMAVDTLDPAASTSAPPAAGVRVGRRRRHWTPIVRDLPAVLSVEVQTREDERFRGRGTWGVGCGRDGVGVVPPTRSQSPRSTCISEGRASLRCATGF